ncbi:hypothetical protein BVG16_11030 [Paenibacillus selenitireducens]|uniref:Uncharacterized protein n=1 Tax=Paenibacillus selenitireducens TaxID=1324314 RepID=A0A1T2XF06_9BACL|nr:hypothetical protein [Paenibacillus selenitireducens]OPA78408.1 hypothetical protein BVG16_11030 [Paenibacillus selenitireducens]
MEISELIEKIIRFFVQSPILGVLILGLLGSFFAKKKNGNSKNRMPSFGGDRDRPFATESSDSDQRDERDEKRIGNEPYRGFEHTSTSESSYSEFDPMAYDYDLNNEGSMEPERRPERLRIVPAPERPESRSERNTLDLNVTRSELAKSVVWAEILGPPRAKKPYGRR